MHCYRAFLAAAVAAFAAISAFASVPAAADDAAGVIAKHAAYVGKPEGLVLTYTYVPSSKAPQAKTTPAPADPTFAPRTETTYRRGGLYRTVMSGEGITEQAGFTGRAFWSANQNGYTVIAYENDARLRLTENLIDGNLLDGVPATSRGAQTIDGTAVDVVRIAPANGVPADIAFDRQTGAYVQITMDPDKKFDAHYVERIDGYVDAGPNVRVPKAYHYAAENAGRYELATHALRAVTNDDLRGPVPTATWSFVSTDAIPIDVAERGMSVGLGHQMGQVRVHATIGGHAGTFLLDSGAAGIILFHPYADGLKYTKLGRTGFVGINGSGVGARYVKLADPIEVGRNTLSNVIVAIQDGKGFSDVDGIVGYDFLAGALVDVDLAAHTIRILDPSKMEPAVGRGAYAFPVNLADRTPQVGMKVAGAIARPRIDTGNSSWITLSYALIDSGRVVALPHDYKVFVGVDGVIGARCSRLSSVEVGPYRYENAETCFGGGAFGQDGGLIGFDFLKHFNWTFDYVDSKLVLTPNDK